MSRGGIRLEYEGSGRPWDINTGSSSSALYGKLGFDYGGDTRMVLTNDGRVGIGSVADPGNALHVVPGPNEGSRGGIRLEYEGSGRPWDINTGSSSSALYGKLGFDYGGDTRMILTSTGNLGIGNPTGDPENLLHVKGTRAGNRAGIRIEYSGGSGPWDLNTGDSSSALYGNLGFDYGGDSKMVLTSTGNLGVGTPDPTERLVVAGNVQADSYLCNSSRELKKDVASLTEKDYSKVLETINQLEVVRYRYKEDSAEDKLHIGLIAEDSPKDILSQDGKSVSLYDSVGYLLASTKALIQQNEGLAKELTALKGEIQAIRASR
ncbi:MAG: tail fiber domain-containing protein [Deltaproteobacteria bacterium]|nr:tail fiber domain-containing protein [Deltaproteobacteria bacterium]